MSTPLVLAHTDFSPLILVLLVLVALVIECDDGAGTTTVTAKCNGDFQHPRVDCVDGKTEALRKRLNRLLLLSRQLRTPELWALEPGFRLQNVRITTN